MPKSKWSKKKAVGFYESWDWKMIRFTVLMFYDRKCMCCGMGVEDGARLVVDHIKPLRRYPEKRLVFNNLQVLCSDCNMGKSWDIEADLRPKLPEGAYEHLDSI